MQLQNMFKITKCAHRTMHLEDCLNYKTFDYYNYCYHYILISKDDYHRDIKVRFKQSESLPWHSVGRI